MTRVLLGTYSLISRAVCRLKAGLVRVRILKRRTPPLPVISVGNLTCGGSVKTPLAMELIGFLESLGFKPALVSRGYKSRWERRGGILSDGRTLSGGWKEAGDEPVLIATRFPRAGVFVGRHRLASCLKARDLGGKVGTVAISYCWRNGQPRAEVHNAKNVLVHEWADREELVPAWATQVWLYHRDEYDFAKRQYVRKQFWYRRDWTLDEEVVFLPVPYQGDREPNWYDWVDRARSVRHDDGKCHLVWVQNQPGEGVDGYPDYHGQYDALDDLDVIDRKSTRLNSSHTTISRMPSSA
jgi:hypothetical protein